MCHPIITTILSQYGIRKFLKLFGNVIIKVDMNELKQIQIINLIDPEIYIGHKNITK